MYKYDAWAIPLPHEDDFIKAKKSCIKSSYYSICDDYHVNLKEI